MTPSDPAASPAVSKLPTHEVVNQPPPLGDYDMVAVDPALAESVAREGGAWALERVQAVGRLAGSEAVRELGRQANRHPPELRTFDRYGHRIDEVEFHPAYHELMRLGRENGLSSIAWTAKRPGGHVAHAAMGYLYIQAEAGVCCPLTMTYAVVPALRHQPDLWEQWGPKVLAAAYDPRFVPASEKVGVTFGMAMTEKQGGSDVRANTTRAVPLNGGGAGAEYLLTGHKWFCSAPMSDAFLTLAQTDEGLSCFLVPRWRPDGTRNPFYIQRLKDKLGNRSNASSEIEYLDTWARMVGAPGRGVPTIIEMVQHTRLDAACGNAGLMRRALTEAVHHTAYRAAFGKRLVEQPLMQNVLADLAVECEAATTLMMRVARAFDEAGDPEAELFGRIATAVAKYWVCKRAPGHIYEAMECLGGAGYVEESIQPRLYREAPVNSIWEGSGNVMCLDVLRAMRRTPDTVGVYFAELEAARGGDRRLDAAIDGLKAELADLRDVERRARRVVERMAVTLQGALLVRHGAPAVADAFCASRLAGDHGGAFGTLPAGLDFDGILARATL